MEPTLRGRTCRACHEGFQATCVQVGDYWVGPMLCPSCGEAEAQKEQPAPKEQAKPEEAMRRAGFSDPMLAEKHLGNYYLRQPENRVALEACKAFIREIQKDQPAYRALVLHGAPGRGKSHLARGCARALHQMGIEVKYYLLLDLISECKRRMNQDGRGLPDDLVEQVCRFRGLLILDELGRSAGRAWDRDLVFRIVDRRQDKPTIYLTNNSYAELEQHYDSAVVSRLYGAKAVPFPPSMPDFRALLSRAI